MRHIPIVDLLQSLLLNLIMVLETKKKILLKVRIFIRDLKICMNSDSSTVKSGAARQVAHDWHPVIRICYVFCKANDSPNILLP